MSAITTHVLDTARGTPAQGVEIVLSVLDGDRWDELARGETDADGRLGDLLPTGEPLPPGAYRLHFSTEAYFERSGDETFYPHADVVFRVTDGGGHYHVPLLLSPFGYSTYRGS